MKTIYHVVETVFEHNLFDQKILNKDVVGHRIYDNIEEAVAEAKRFAQNCLLDEPSSDVYRKHIIGTSDELTASDLMATGRTIYREVRDDHKNSYYEAYVAILPRKYSWLKEAFEWFCAFVVIPFKIPKIIRDVKYMKNKYPVDHFAGYINEIKSTPEYKWDEVYDKWFKGDLK